MLKDRLKEIIDLVEASGINEVEISTWWGRKIKVTKQAAFSGNAPVTMQAPTPAPPAIPPISAPEADAKPAAVDSGHKVNAPVVGTFYLASSPDAPPFIKVGDKIKNGQVFCIIEAMKIMNEIESDIDGIVVDILVSNAEPVEYNQPLIIVKPN